MIFHAVVMTHRGLVRRNNEDNFYFDGLSLKNPAMDMQQYRLSTCSQVKLFSVCDGMGGEALGEEASQMAISGLAEVEQAFQSNPDASFREIFHGYLNRVNQDICARILSNNGMRMGTTLAGVLLRDETAQTINLGDTRIYLFRDDVTYQLSVDHTHAQRLVDMGILTKEEGERHPERHRLMQHLGLFVEERTLNPYMSKPFWLKADDRILICSDGLSNDFDQQQIFKHIKRYPNIEEAAKKLLKCALNKGGRDNITLILIAIDSVDEAKHKQIRNVDIVRTPPLTPNDHPVDGKTKEVPSLSALSEVAFEALDDPEAASTPLSSPQGDSKTTSVQRVKGDSQDISKDMMNPPVENNVMPDPYPIEHPKPSQHPVRPVRYPVETLSEADLERFKAAQEAARQRQQQASPVLPTADELARHHAAMQRAVKNRKPQHNVGAPAVVLHTSRAERRRLTDVGVNQTTWPKNGALEDSKALNTEGRAGRKKGLFRLFLIFILSALMTFAIIWIMLKWLPFLPF